MTFGLHVFNEPRPAGSTLQDNSNYHHLFRKDVIDLIPHHELYQHTSVTSMMSDLANFNPTSKALNYYKETEAYKTLHNKEQMPRMGYHDNFNLDIPNKINFMKKKELTHTLPNMVDSLRLV